MEIPMSQEEEMPIPLNTRYIGEPIIHNHTIIPSSSSSPPQIPSSTHDNTKKIVIIKYKECLKNHAASMGGNATDGCGEFMPNGEEGTLEALICSACNCHRNFHRKEIEGQQEQPTSSFNNTSCYYNVNPKIGRKIYVGHPQNYHSAGKFISSRDMINSYDNSDDEEGGGVGGVGVGVGVRPSQVVKKRFRTKFSQEQKDKMLKFAERVGWKIQKQEESLVQNFCQEIGVKRRVLKVWMHNNKHHFAKKNNLLPNDGDHQDQG